jgi:hypothetical protein
MKRSEMIKCLQKRFYFGESEVIADLADEIIDFLVEQGMQPPPTEVQEYLVPAQDEQEALLPYTTTVNQWTPEEAP